MDIAILGPAILATVAGLAVFIFIVQLFFRSLCGDPRNWGDGWKLHRKARLLNSFETRYGGGSPTEELLRTLQRAFYLDLISTEKMIPKIRSHNVACFARILSLSENFEGQIRNLGTAEELLQARMELLELYLKTKNVQSKIARRLEEKERSIPTWSKEEFERKLESVIDQLKTNRYSLEGQLKEIFNALRNIQSSPNVVYH